MGMREVTAAERAALMGTKDYMGVPLEVWEHVKKFNQEVDRRYPPAEADRLVVSVVAAPLLAAVYHAGQESVGTDEEHLTRPEQIAEREMLQAGQPVVNEDGS